MTSAPPPRTRHRIGAVIVASFIPGFLAAAIIAGFPQACQLRGDPNLYRWICLLPRLLLVLPMVIAFVLPLAGWLNRRLKRPLPDGWIAVALFAGLATQLAFVGIYALVLDPAYFRRFLAESLYIPQPFITGAITAVCYVWSLDWLARRAERQK